MNSLSGCEPNGLGDLGSEHEASGRWVKWGVTDRRGLVPEEKQALPITW